jgi:hypothetical protein
LFGPWNLFWNRDAGSMETPRSGALSFGEGLARALNCAGPEAGAPPILQPQLRDRFFAIVSYWKSTGAPVSASFRRFFWNLFFRLARLANNGS